MKQNYGLNALFPQDVLFFFMYNMFLFLTESVLLFRYTSAAPS